MLEELRIRGLGVIEESVLELGPGFTAITGETGAGKTMVVTALGLLLGGRADSGAVRTGAERARVEGVVHVGGSTATGESSARVREVLGGAGGQLDEGRLLLARQVSGEGRSRAFAGGVGVPAAVLAELAGSLVAVHGQSDQHRLLRAGAQRDALDRFAGEPAATLRSQYERDHAALRATEAQLADVLTHRRERAREADLLRFGLDEVERAGPRSGEDAELAAEENRLAFADALRAAADQARAALSADEGPDALGAVGAARRLLDGVRGHDPRAAELADRAAEVGYLLADLAGDVASYASGLETDPARLAAVSERRAVLGALTRKYGATVDDVLAWAEQAARRLLELDDTDGLVHELRGRCDTLLAGLAETGARLTEVRQEAAVRLAAAVTEELRALAMPYAEVVVRVGQADTSEEAGEYTRVKVADRWVRLGGSGLDEVELTLAANPGTEPRPLAKGASGGELSRVMLAIEVALAGTDPVPTFVFDEVDAGVGGKAAVEVGRRLALLARAAQVLVVTHLPQVAAFADHHVVVTKTDDGRVTSSGLRALDDEGRLRELSRMLAGLEGSETAVAHAQELLAAARAGVAAKERGVAVSR